jgi:hypothetical protein
MTLKVAMTEGRSRGAGARPMTGIALMARGSAP